MLVPALGGKIRDVTLAGRQWFWHNKAIPFARPAEGAAYATAGDSGGLDECFPTIEACRLPTWVKGAGDLTLPDHGELWSREPEVAFRTDEHGHSATCSWTGGALPYRFARTVTVRRDAAIDFAYVVENTGPNRLPFVWAPQAVFPLAKATRLVLPDGARVRVWTQHGVDFGRPGVEQHWPRLRLATGMADFSRPGAALKGQFACKLFVELPGTATMLAIEEGGARLEMHVDGTKIPRVGISINQGGWTPFEKTGSFVPAFLRRRHAYNTLSVQPCIGAPDSLTEALGAWDSADWVEPGASAAWSMTWRGARVENA